MGWLRQDAPAQKKSWLRGSSNSANSASNWIDDPDSLLKESDFSKAQKSMRTEVINKTGTLRDRKLPVPGEGDDRNWLERKLNTPQDTGFLGDVLDVISRGQYASANIAKTLTDDKKDSFKSVLGSGYRGLVGQDKTSYRDVLEQSGMEQGKLRSALGFAGDVLLDPTTYLTLGTGTAAKIGGKTAAKGLGKVVPELLGKEAIDRGGVKFMGASLIPGSVIEKGAEKAGLFKAGNLLRDTKPVQTLGKALVPNFREAGTEKNVWSAFVDTKKGYQNSLSYAQNKAIEDAIKMAKGYTQAERTQATHAIQDPRLYNMASDRVKSLANIANKSFNDSAQIEKELGLLKNPRPNSPLGDIPKINSPMNYRIKQTIPKPTNKVFDLTRNEFDKMANSGDYFIRTVRTPSRDVAGRVSTPSGPLGIEMGLEGAHKGVTGFSLKDSSRLKEWMGREGWEHPNVAIYKGRKLGDGPHRLEAEFGADELVGTVPVSVFKEANGDAYEALIRQAVADGKTIDPSIAKEYAHIVPKESPKDLGKIKLKTREPVTKSTSNYVPGIYPDKTKSFLQGITNNPGIRATIGSHGKQKKFDTLQDAIDAGLKPETDIAKLVGSRQVVSARATETQKFINETLDKYGTKINAKNIDELDPSMGVYLPKGSLAFFPSGTVPDEVLELVKGMSKDEMIEIPAGVVKNGMLVSKNVPVYALPKQIAGELNNFKKLQTDEGSKGILGAYDNVLNLWKAYATAVNPGFHIRNAQSNVFQTTLNSGKELLNPMNHLRALGTNTTKLPLAGSRISNKTIDVGGRKMTLGEVSELMKKEGVTNTGWIGKDIPNYIEKQLDEGLKGKLQKVPQLLNPLSQNNALIKGGRAVGGLVEDQARSFNFLSEMNKTGDAKQAAKVVDKNLFDYGDVTPFEKNVLKRTVPFYTWLRKNVPLQAENIIRTPGKYAATDKALDGVRDLSNPIDERNMPEYMDNPNWVKTPLQQDGNPMYWNSNLPMGDLEKLNPSQIGKTALGSLSPLLKAPLELQLNQNTFFGDEIEEYPGEMIKAPGYVPDLPEPVVKMLGAQYGLNKEEARELQVPARVRYMMSQVPFMENVSKSIDAKGEKKFNQLLSFLLGAKITPFDAKKAEMNKLYEQRDALRDAFDKYQTQGVLESDDTLAEEKKKTSTKKSTSKWLK